MNETHANQRVDRRPLSRNVFDQLENNPKRARAANNESQDNRGTRTDTRGQMTVTIGSTVTSMAHVSHPVVDELR